ncbi:MAG: hypothetical protein IJ057_10350 [Bacteroidales bacterium]|nr:hypothetical protein [Bacteroidales bacterium]
MEKVRQYESKRIEICRNCGGTGHVTPKVEGNFLLRRLQCPERLVPCDVCDGSGRVEKTINIAITVKSFQ